jgi:hypothetical protein
MSGKSSLAASAEQRDGLRRLAVSANPAEADRARAILLRFPAGRARRSARFSECVRTRCATGARRSCAKVWPASSDILLIQ